MQANITTPGNEQPEEWRPVVGWEGWYDVSSLGRVRRVCGHSAGRVLRSQHNAKDKYIRVSLYRHGSRKIPLVHVLVAAAFLGPCPAGHEVDHKDSNRTNAAASNLQYLTHLENMREASKRGSTAMKLTAEQVQEIRASSVHHGDLQWQYGVSAAHIKNIRQGKVRKGVPPLPA